MARLIVEKTNLQIKSLHQLNAKFCLFSLASLLLFAIFPYFMISPELSIMPNLPVWFIGSIFFSYVYFHVLSRREIYISKTTNYLLIACILLTLPFLFKKTDISHSWTHLLSIWGLFCLFACIQQFTLSFKLTYNQRNLLLFMLVLSSYICVLIRYIGEKNYGIHADHRSLIPNLLILGFNLASYLFTRFPHNLRASHTPVMLLLHIAPIILLPAIIHSHSPIAWLILMLSFIFTYPRLYRTLNTKLFIQWSGACISGILLGLWLFHFAPLKDTASHHMFLIWQQTLSMLQHALMGYGYGNLETAYVQFTANAHAIDAAFPAALGHYQEFMGEFMRQAIEGGIFAILGMSIIGVICVKILRKTQTQQKGFLYAIFIPLLLQSLYAPSFSASILYGITFIILLAWGETISLSFKGDNLKKCQLKVESTNQNHPLYYSVFLIPIIIFVLTILTQRTNHLLFKVETSQGEQIDLIDKIQQPLYWSERYLWDKAYFNRTKNKLTQRTFIRQAKAQIQSTPRAEIYLLLIQAYESIEDHSAAIQTRNEAHFLFPNDLRFISK